MCEEGRSRLSDLVFLKLGGSLVTDKGGAPVFHADRARALAGEILEAKSSAGLRLVIGHGAGSFGHAPAKRHRVAEGLPGGGDWVGYAETRRGVIELNARLLAVFAEAGLHPVFVQPSAIAAAHGGRLKSMDTGAIRRLLEAEQVPMVCGDAVLDDALGFTIISTEGFFAWLAEWFRPRRIVLACDVEGVFEENPRANPGARLIARVDESNIERVLSGSRALGGADVTGGMAGKVQALHQMVRRVPEAEVRIVSGLVPGRVKDALTGRGGGTLVAR